MRRLLTLAVAATLLMACDGGSSGTGTSTPGGETNASPTASVTPAATPFPTTAEDAVAEQTVRTCITPDLAEGASDAAIQLAACLNRGEAVFHVLAVDGDVPVVLVETRGDPSLGCRANAFIVWLKDGWHVQNATALLPSPTDDRLLGQHVGSPPIGPMQPSSFAREATDGGTRLLSVMAGVDCNPSPGTFPMLFALDGDAWQLAWKPHDADRGPLTAPSAEFTDPTGIDRIHVRGTLWELSSQAVFHESRPGPHRYVDQTWTRDGRRYFLADEHIVPSAYNTLYNFVFRLSTGDDNGAAALLADPSLLGAARQLGLAQEPLGQGWMMNSDASSVCCGPIHVLSGPEWRGPPQPVVVTFVQRGADWLIAGIAAE